MVGMDTFYLFHIIKICRNLSQVIPLTVLIENDKWPGLTNTYAILKLTTKEKKKKKQLARIPKYFNASSGIDSDLIFSDCLASVFWLSTSSAGPVSMSEVCLLYSLSQFAHFIEVEDTLSAEWVVTNITEYGKKNEVKDQNLL